MTLRILAVLKFVQGGARLQITAACAVGFKGGAACSFSRGTSSAAAWPRPPLHKQLRAPKLRDGFYVWETGESYSIMLRS